jgi:hypothetical protein
MAGAIECASPGTAVLTGPGPLNPLAAQPSGPDVPLSQRRVGGLGLVVVKVWLNRYPTGALRIETSFPFELCRERLAPGRSQVFHKLVRTE